MCMLHPITIAEVPLTWDANACRPSGALWQHRLVVMRGCARALLFAPLNAAPSGPWRDSTDRPCKRRFVMVWISERRIHSIIVVGCS